MDPTKIQKHEMALAPKIPKREFIQPGALAKGIGKSLKAMGTLRVNAEQRTPIAKNRSSITTTSKLNMLADKNFLMHPSFAEMEDNVPLYDEVEVTQDDLTSDARSRGKISRISVEKGTHIGKNRSNPSTSNLNKLPKISISVPHDFCPIEDNDTLNLEEGVTRYGKRSDTVAGPFESKKGTKVVEIDRNAQRSGSPFVFKKTKDVVEATQYTERSLFEYEKARKVSEVSHDAQRSDNRPSEFEKAKNVAETIRDAKKSRLESKKANEVAEVTRDVQRSLIDYGKAKKVNEVSQDAQKVNEVSRFSGPSKFQKAKKVAKTIQDAEKSRLESEKANEVAEVTRNGQRNEKNLFESEKSKRVRGMNICKKVLRLRPGEKLRVTFYQNRVVGENQSSFSRHLGLLVRDRNMCPLAVHSWNDIEEHKLDHMWAAVIEKFDSDDMNEQRENVLRHMRKLWTSWRGDLHQYVKSKSLHEVLKVAPDGIDKIDWEWLIKEHFLSEKFKKASERNSINRSKLRMPHRTGSKPIREVVYELGGKDGNPPNMATIFFETRKKGNRLVEPEAKEKYAEMQKLLQSEPSLTNIEVVERVFGPQCKSHVVGFGGGITAKELKGGATSKAALLEELKATRKEKDSLQKRMDILESRCGRLESILVPQHSSPPSDQEFEDQEFEDQEFDDERA